MSSTLAVDFANVALAVSDKIDSGGVLWCVSPGRPEHARHLAVEFVHPVIVGKRAVPAVSLDGPDIVASVGAMVRPGDVVIAVGDPGTAAVDVLELCAGWDALGVWVGAGDEWPGVRPTEHVLWVEGDAEQGAYHDGRMVLAYHLLWELTHACLEDGGTGPGTDDGALDFLYPSLSGGGGDDVALHELLVRSARAKTDESTALRSRALGDLGESIATAAKAVERRFAVGGRLLAFGNGGSSTDASSLASLFAHPPSGVGLPARTLTDDAAVVTALSNDVGYERVFSRQLIAAGRPEDIAVGFSTSGNSPNLMVAFEEARRRGMLTIGFAGYDGGDMAGCDAIDHLFVVESDSVHRIQETQDAVGFALWHAVAGLVP